MAKYQFFELTQDGKKLVRYLCTDLINFTQEKDRLLAQGFEVMGDMIYAGNEEEAIAHFNSGMVYPLEEYNKSNIVGGLFYCVKSLAESASGLLHRRSDN
ncbi:hypothetical protein HQ393_02265 [Chitinibacter bivalviorum]|uniref:Uncharacterized protein n=1 Tax=Chitinibacter bivalviorum TaxID=2739434 RepID=A0A7H9BF26_9NEIS|nr:hypothetical protein [Chitinibacter bivalviorum]QLG87165.1 hypothetical protein HQ393_02265 [Chitinibacter bivalviorum]